MPVEPQIGQDLLQFEKWDGLRWNHTKAIEFWSICPPAFETSEATEKHIGWFETQPGMEGIALQELGNIALELIRRFAVFEMRSPGGYSLEAHMSALRSVMPTISAEAKFDLKDLPAHRGLTLLKLQGIVAIPNYKLDAWAVSDDNFDEADVENENTWSADGNEDPLFTEGLNEYDMNVAQTEEGLPATDDVTSREYDKDSRIAIQLEEEINATFSETLKAALEKEIATNLNYIRKNPHLRLVAS